MKWNQDIRRIVYRLLMETFGSCENWHNRANPTGNYQEYKDFLERIADGLAFLTNNKCTSSAVKQQILWGIQKKQSTCKNVGYLRNFIDNRAMALEIGLINSKDLPSYALFDYKKDVSNDEPINIIWNQDSLVFCSNSDEEEWVENIICGEESCIEIINIIEDQDNGDLYELKIHGDNTYLHHVNKNLFKIE